MPRRAPRTGAPPPAVHEDDSADPQLVPRTDSPGALEEERQPLCEITNAPPAAAPADTERMVVVEVNLSKPKKKHAKSPKKPRIRTVIEQSADKENLSVVEDECQSDESVATEEACSQLRRSPRKGTLKPASDTIRTPISRAAVAARKQLRPATPSKFPKESVDYPGAITSLSRDDACSPTGQALCAREGYDDDIELQCGKESALDATSNHEISIAVSSSETIRSDVVVVRDITTHNISDTEATPTTVSPRDTEEHTTPFEGAVESSAENFDAQVDAADATDSALPIKVANPTRLFGEGCLPSPSLTRPKSTELTTNMSQATQNHDEASRKSTSSPAAQIISKSCGSIGAARPAAPVRKGPSATVKGRKPPTTSATFILPGGAVAARLRAQREERALRQASNNASDRIAEKATATVRGTSFAGPNSRARAIAPASQRLNKVAPIVTSVKNRPAAMKGPSTAGIVLGRPRKTSVTKFSSIRSAAQSCKTNASSDKIAKAVHAVPRTRPSTLSNMSTASARSGSRISSAGTTATLVNGTPRALHKAPVHPPASLVGVFTPPTAEESLAATTPSVRSTVGTIRPPLSARNTPPVVPVTVFAAHNRSNNRDTMATRSLQARPLALTAGNKASAPPNRTAKGMNVRKGATFKESLRVSSNLAVRDGGQLREKAATIGQATMHARATALESERKAREAVAQKARIQAAERGRAASRAWATAKRASKVVQVQAQVQVVAASGPAMEEVLEKEELAVEEQENQLDAAVIVI